MGERHRRRLQRIARGDRRVAGRAARRPAGDDRGVARERSRDGQGGSRRPSRQRAGDDVRRTGRTSAPGHAISRRSRCRALEVLRDVVRHDEPELKAKGNGEEQTPVPGCFDDSNVRSATGSGHHRWRILSHRTSICVSYFVTHANPKNTANIMAPRTHTHTRRPPPVNLTRDYSFIRADPTDGLLSGNPTGRRSAPPRTHAASFGSFLLP